jgi:hypothetical protein
MLIATSDEAILIGPRLSPITRAQNVVAKLREAQDFA